jgi:hypothetical protein
MKPSGSNRVINRKQRRARPQRKLVTECMYRTSDQDTRMREGETKKALTPALHDGQVSGQVTRHVTRTHAQAKRDRDRAIIGARDHVIRRARGSRDSRDRDEERDRARS